MLLLCHLHCLLGFELLLESLLILDALLSFSLLLGELLRSRPGDLGLLLLLDLLDQVGELLRLGDLLDWLAVDVHFLRRLRGLLNRWLDCRSLTSLFLSVCWRRYLRLLLIQGLSRLLSLLAVVKHLETL